MRETDIERGGGGLNFHWGIGPVSWKWVIWYVQPILNSTTVDLPASVPRYHKISCFCFFMRWLLHFSPVWLSSVSLKLSTWTQYLNELLTVYKPTCQLRSSSDTSMFFVLFVFCLFLFSLCVHTLAWSEICFFCCNVRLEQSTLQIKSSNIFQNTLEISHL